MTDDEPTIAHPKAAAVAIATGTPRVGVRQYFATEHLWNSRHMTRLCKEREDALVADGFQGLDMQVRSYAVAAVLEAVAFLEALVNAVWQDAADSPPGQANSNLTGLTEAVVARLRELWMESRVERSLSVLDKYRVALVCADQPPLEAGAEPYQSVHAVMRLRNTLVHFKPELQWMDEVHALEDLLKPRISENPLFHGHPWFPHRVLTAGCAAWASTACVDLATQWWQRMGLQRDYLADIGSWPQP